MPMSGASVGTWLFRDGSFDMLVKTAKKIEKTINFLKKYLNYSTEYDINFYMKAIKLS